MKPAINWSCSTKRPSCGIRACSVKNATLLTSGAAKPLRFKSFRAAASSSTYLLPGS
ncbi:hypothetical protein [Burkholderia plantarii]|uniref:hypothetical protein n=1 Tax=Burkholderia plantarii TaxID=41899 RepID=UPI0018DB8AED|nr:hypothetical protein [Burkholderia plantarii]MBI0327292.1 hypothetical protein [Burkholderia plantarii]